jgi:hypothetical protein
LVDAPPGPFLLVGQRGESLLATYGYRAVTLGGAPSSLRSIKRAG